MLILRQMRRNAAAVVVFCLTAAGVGFWLLMPMRTRTGRTIPTGASFNVAVSQPQDSTKALRLASNIEASGFPAFTRATDNGWRRQVVVGPYLAIDEAERAQRLLMRRGFGARMLVDESVRRVAGHDGIPYVSDVASVVLVSGAGRLSVVVELPTEPRTVFTRRVSPTLLEVDIAAPSGPVEPQGWNAPAGVDLVGRVTLAEAHESGRHMLRTQLSVQDVTLSNVRVSGRRVYIDLWSADALSNERVGRVRAETRATHVGPLPETEAPNYREVIRPALARLKSMEPFVLSAIASPSPEVMAALAATLAGLGDWLRVIEPQEAWLAQHRVLLAGIALAAAALDPGFAGDRAAQARESFALIEQARIDLAAPQNNQTPPTPIATSAAVAMMVR